MMETTAPLVDFLEYCRPRSFSEVAGNAHIKRKVRRMVAGLGIPKAVLIHAPVGMCKTTLARLIACTSFCDERPNDEIDPCGSCEPCRFYLRRSLGVCFEKHLYYVNCANVTVDDVRLHQEMSRSGESIFIYDEFARATWKLQDSLLTWIEDGQATFRVIICTTSLNEKVLAPALAHRCHLLEPAAPTTSELVVRLRAICDSLRETLPNVRVVDDVLRQLCTEARNNPRVAINILHGLLLEADDLTMSNLERLRRQQ